MKDVLKVASKVETALAKRILSKNIPARREEFKKFEIIAEHFLEKRNEAYLCRDLSETLRYDVRYLILRNALSNIVHLLEKEAEKFRIDLSYEEKEGLPSLLGKLRSSYKEIWCRKGEVELNEILGLFEDIPLFNFDWTPKPSSHLICLWESFYKFVGVGIPPDSVYFPGYNGLIRVYKLPEIDGFWVAASCPNESGTRVAVAKVLGLKGKIRAEICSIKLSL